MVLRRDALVSDKSSAESCPTKLFARVLRKTWPKPETKHEKSLAPRVRWQQPRDEIYIYVVVNFLFQLIFIFPLFWGMVMYANEFKTKEKQKLTEIKN